MYPNRKDRAVDMSLKRSVVIDDRRCICKNCTKSNTCDYYTNYQKLLDNYENKVPDKFLIKMVCYIKKCNQFLKDKEK